MLDAQRERDAMISSRAPLISTRNFSARSISFRAAAFHPTNSREIRTVFQLNVSSSHSATTTIPFSARCAKFIHLHLVGFLDFVQEILLENQAEDIVISQSENKP